MKFKFGETVRVADVPFESHCGIIEAIDEEASKLRVAVTIFGRSTPIELEYSQVDQGSEPRSMTNKGPEDRGGLRNGGRLGNH